MRVFSRFTSLRWLFPVCFVTLSAQAQDDLSVLPYWQTEAKQASTGLYDYLCRQAAGPLAQRQAQVAKLRTRADWQGRQAQVRQQLRALVGPFPAHTPLNAVVTGTLQRDDFTVEKLYFQSRPNYFVTAALFIPKTGEAQKPAILYCSGHLTTAFRDKAYQRTLLNLVKKGFVVLAFDPVGQGERRQYLDFPAKFSPSHEHSYPGVQSFVAGVSPANYFIWDGIRAIDYLVSRPEVDSRRVGITGRSGGGTQSAYIAAFDDRIVASAVECYLTTFDKLLRSRGPQDAEQNLLFGLKNGIDLADFLAVRAPKPGLIVSTTQDIFSIQGARDVFAETRRAYDALGRPGDIRMVEDDAGHESTIRNREATYAFFQNYLNHPGDATDLTIMPFTEDELRVLPAGQTITTLGSETLHSLTTRHLRADANAPKPLTQSQLQTAIGYQQPTAPPEVIFSGRLKRDGYHLEKYLLRGPGGYCLPLLWSQPATPNGKTTLLLDDRGKNKAAAAGEWVEQLTRAGYAVVAPDLSGFGELQKSYLDGGDSEVEGVPLNLWFMGALVQKSLLGVRVEELDLLTRFIRDKAGANALLSVVARGTLCADLLHALVLQPGFQRAVLFNPLVSYRSLVAERQFKPAYALSTVPGALPRYDLPDLLASVAQTTVVVVDPVDATGQVLAPTQALEAYKNALKKPSVTVRSLNKPDEYPSLLLDGL